MSFVTEGAKIVFFHKAHGPAIQCTGALNGCLRIVTIPDAVTIQFDLLKTSMVLLETSRGL